MRALPWSALALAGAACAAPKDSARRDSTDSLPPAVAAETVRGPTPTPMPTPTRHDTAGSRSTARPRPEAMPNAPAHDSADRMPATHGDKAATPMPNATPAPAKTGTRPAPPKRVVPDPVLPPRDSTTKRP